MSDDGDHDDDVVGVGGRWEGRRRKRGRAASCGHRGRSLCGDGKLDMHRRRVLSHYSNIIGAFRYDVCNTLNGNSCKEYTDGRGLPSRRLLMFGPDSIEDI